MVNNHNCNDCPMQDKDSKAASSVDGTSSGTGHEPKDAAGSQLLQRDPYELANVQGLQTSLYSSMHLDVLAAVQSVIPEVVNSVANITGYMCEVWFPHGTPSAYGKNDNKIRYSTEPQLRQCFLGANLMTTSSMGTSTGEEFGTFVSEMPYLLTVNYYIPENSKVKIYYGNSYRWMKVRRHDASDGAGTYAGIYNYLSPCTSAGVLINDDPLPTDESTLVIDTQNAEGTVKAGQNLI